MTGRPSNGTAARTDAERFRSVLITGASSGLGAALAARLAAPGVSLALGGRDAARLDHVAAQCRAHGADARSEAVDVRAAGAMAAWVTAADARAPLDLVIACAGISGEAQKTDDAEHARAIYLTNVLGVLNTVAPLIPAMRARGRGQIAVIASAAGFRGFARGPAYSASKAALIVHCQGWRDALAPSGVGVSCICPGYIATPMTAHHDFSLPFALDPADAAERTLRAVARNAACHVFPWQVAVGTWLWRTLPAAVTRILIPGGRPRP